MNLSILKPLLSRKFIITVLCTVLGIAFVPDVDGELKLKFLVVMAGVYAVPNVAQKFLTKSEDAV
jgi:hypothetical protein